MSYFERMINKYCKEWDKAVLGEWHIIDRKERKLLKVELNNNFEEARNNFETDLSMSPSSVALFVVSPCNCTVRCVNHDGVFGARLK